MFKRILILLALLTLTNISQALAQKPIGPPLTPAEVNELLRLAELRITEYREKFIDLSTVEDQEIHEFDRDGKLKRQRRIVSDLVIYQSQLDPSSMSEYRNVRSVDGITVKKRDERLMNLFGHLAKADSVKKELERINRESRRYDLNYSSYGFTLNEGLLLLENLRPAFQFTYAGREQIKGRDVFVLQYQQTAQQPDIAFKFSSLPNALKGAETLYRGRVWLDAETSQLWREERELTIQHPSLRQPLVLMRFEFEYASSRFGILTPQQIVFSIFNNGRTLSDKTPDFGLGGKVTARYSEFTRFNVSSPDAIIAPPGKP